MPICQACGGVIGIDCFNPIECAQITANINRECYNTDNEPQLSYAGFNHLSKIDTMSPKENCCDSTLFFHQPDCPSFIVEQSTIPVVDNTDNHMIWWNELSDKERLAWRANIDKASRKSASEWISEFYLQEHPQQNNNAVVDYEKDLAVEILARFWQNTGRNGRIAQMRKEAFIDGVHWIRARQMSSPYDQKLKQELEWWKKEESIKCELIIELRNKLAASDTNSKEVYSDVIEKLNTLKYDLYNDNKRDFSRRLEEQINVLIKTNSTGQFDNCKVKELREWVVSKWDLPKTNIDPVELLNKIDSLFSEEKANSLIQQ